MDDDSLMQRVEQLEARIRHLEENAAGAATTPTANAPAVDPAPYDPETFWVLDGLAQRLPDVGSVVYAGRLESADGPVAWQYGAATDDLLDRPWGDLATTLAALGSPVRLEILRAVLRGAHTAAELLDEVGSGTTGQIYHHLNQLTAAGWLVTAARGHFAVPADRVIPLLTALTAAGGVR